MDKLKNIVNPGHSEVDDLLYDTGKKHQRGESELDPAANSDIAGKPSMETSPPPHNVAGQSTIDQPGQNYGAPFTGAAAQDTRLAEQNAPGHQHAMTHQHDPTHKHDPAYQHDPTHRHEQARGAAVAGTTADENNDPSKPKKEGGVMNKILHPFGQKDKTGHDETASEHHDRGKHAAEGIAAGGSAAAVASHEKHRHDDKHAHDEKHKHDDKHAHHEKLHKEPPTPAAAVAGKHSPSEEKHDTTERKPSLIQKILHPGSSKTDKDTTTTDPSAKEHHHGRDAALDAGALGAAGAAGHKHHKNEDPATHSTTSSHGLAKAAEERHGLLGAKDGAMGAGAGGVAGHYYASGRDPAARPAEPTEYTGARAGEEPRARFGAKDGAMGSGAAGVAGTAYAANREHSSNHPSDYTGPRAGEEPRQHYGAKDSALGVGPAGIAGLAYAADKKHDHDKTATGHSHTSSEKHGDKHGKTHEKEDTSTERKPSIIQRILHPGSSKSEKEAGDHSSHVKEPHHHHGAEAAAAGAVGVHEHKKHEHKKEEHKRDVPAHERMTTTHSHQQGAGIPTERARDYHHTGRDAALGAGAVGAGTAAHHEKHHHQQGAGIPTEKTHDHHHTGRDAALGAGTVGVGTAAHQQKYHQHEAPPRGTDPMHTDAPASAGTGIGPAGGTQGPHKTNIANILDPRVKPDFEAQREHKEERKAAAGAGPTGSTGAPTTSQYTPAAAAVARGDPLTGSTPQTTGAPPEAVQQHHYGRDAALGASALGAGGAAYAAHRHHDDKTGQHAQDAATSSSGAPATTGLADSNAYSRQEQPASSQPIYSREVGNTAPAGGAAAAYGSQGFGQHNELTHHVHNGVTGAHSKEASHHEHFPHRTAPTQDQDRSHYGRDAAMGGGAATAAASAAYAAHQHGDHGHDHGKDELSHHQHNSVTGTGSPSAPAARQAASAAYSTQGSSGTAHPTTKEEEKHHHGRDAALGAGAAGAAGAAAHQHEKHHEEEKSAGEPEKKESMMSRIMDKIMPGKSTEHDPDTTSTTTDHRGTNVPVSERSVQDRAIPGEEGKVGDTILGVPADQKLHTDPQQKEHNILRQVLNPNNHKVDDTRFGTTAHTGTSASEATSGISAPPNTSSSEAKHYHGVPEAKHPAAVSEASGNQSDNPYSSKPLDPRVTMPGSFE